MPSVAPLTAPISEITADSQRTIARTWLRVIPTARNLGDAQVWIVMWQAWDWPN